MLIKLMKLNKISNLAFCKRFQNLQSLDKKYFRPHSFDLETINCLYKEKGNHYFLYSKYGQFVGYGMLRTFGEYEFPSLGCIIWEEFRGQGYGKKLVEELIEKANELGFKKIMLKVNKKNKVAYSLFKKIGFREINKKEKELVFMEYEKGIKRSD